MNNELYINEVFIPLSPESDIALSYQINNVASVKDIRGNNSNTFSVPLSAETRRALGFSDEITSASKAAYRKLPARYYQNGVDLLRGGGIAIIQESRTLERVADIEVYSGNLDFFARIDSLKLGDLKTLSAYNHKWDANSVVSSQNNTAGFIYPIIDYGDLLSTGNQLRSDRLFPAMYVHTIVTAIFREAGFIPVGAVLSSDLYLNLILPFSNAKPYVPADFGKDRSFRASTIAYQRISDGGVGSNDIEVDLILDNIDDERLNYFGGKFGYDPITGLYTATDNFNANISASTYVRVEVTSQVTTVDAWLRLFINNIEIINGHEHYGPSLSAGGEFKTIGFSLENYPIKTGDVLRLHLSGDVGNFSSVEFIILKEDAPSGATATYFKLAVTDTLQYGGDWNAVQNLPDLTQTEFLKNIAQIECVIFQTNSNGNTVQVRQFDEIANNAANAKDWSNKLDLSRESRLTYRLDYAQQNKLKYKEEEGVIVEGANGIIYVDDTTLPLSKDYFTMAFGATMMVKKLGGLDIAQILLFEKGELKSKVAPRILIMSRAASVSGTDILRDAINVTTVYMGTSESSVITDRPHGFVVGQLVSVVGCLNSSLDFKNEPVTVVSTPYSYDTARTGTQTQEDVSAERLGQVYTYSQKDTIYNNIPIPYFILPNKSVNLGFANNLINQNYTRLIQCLNPLQIKEEYYYLTETDIDQLDHFIPVWVEKHNAYFYIQQIKGFKNNQMTKCILIRL